MEEDTGRLVICDNKTHPVMLSFLISLGDDIQEK